MPTLKRLPRNGKRWPFFDRKRELLTFKLFKFRKKQKQRNIGFFYNFDKMQNKLNVIKPIRPPSPIINIEPKKPGIMTKLLKIYIPLV